MVEFDNKDLKDGLVVDPVGGATYDSIDDSECEKRKKKIERNVCYGKEKMEKRKEKREKFVLLSYMYV